MEGQLNCFTSLKVEDIMYEVFNVDWHFWEDELHVKDISRHWKQTLFGTITFFQGNADFDAVFPSRYRYIYRDITHQSFDMRVCAALWALQAEHRGPLLTLFLI
jgi:hypothetical protein